MDEDEMIVKRSYPRSQVVGTPRRPDSPYKILDDPAGRAKAVGWGSSEKAAWADAAIIMKYAS